MFLTDADVQRLTGYERPGKQVEWLRENRIHHFTNAHNKVIVAVDALSKTSRIMREPFLDRMGH